MVDRELSVSDIAKMRGVSRKTAWRWLCQLEKKYGPSVIGRRGKKGVLFTTRSAMEKIAPLAKNDEGFERRCKDLEERLDDAERRADKQAEVISELTRQLESLRRALQGRMR